MNEFKEAKDTYEETPVPAELGERVQRGIRQGRARRAMQKRRRFFTGAAACFAVAVGALNLSPTVAAAAAEVPVLGGFFQLLTVRSFTDTNADRTVEVEVPGLSGTDFAQEIDAQIQSRVDEKLAEGEKIVSETKAAFLATGGTEAEWAQRDTTVKVDYDVKSQTDTAVSFVVNSMVSVASAYQEQFFYNLDLKEGRELTLADLLGADWATVCNDSIRAQMAAAEDPSVYFDASMGGFSTVDEGTEFYIGENGNPVVVFPRASVAIGAMGTVEFEIVK
ncbi:RsiV family protein [Oscillibacter sp.]|uniref:RsiV family protein n=1 Tax=Oscillibacter sp. TaxID=1945593 RepID=UPI0026285C73|nr:RsiV family protein [Oscillibacter sp.]MDD3347731.1 RsiV family protein [Oscillibacter sp.]